MSFNLDIKLDISKAQKKLFDMENTIVKRAASRAINRTLSQVKTQAVKELKSEIGATSGLSAAGLRKAILEKKATPFRLYGELKPTGKSIPLIYFGARQVSGGVSAKVNGKRRIYKGTFIAKMGSGRKGVFRRLTDARLPIKELFGPSIPTSFSNEKIVATMRRLANSIWNVNFSRELKYYLSRLK